MQLGNVKFRTQWDDPLPYPEIDFPESCVQPGMSPSISQMVKTKSVGGNVDVYEMDGIESDAPFDSEYLDYFDLQDAAMEIQEAADAERRAAEKPGGNPESQKNPVDMPGSEITNNDQRDQG